jgi:hypothetical protein
LFAVDTCNNARIPRSWSRVARLLPRRCPHCRIRRLHRSSLIYRRPDFEQNCQRQPAHKPIHCPFRVLKNYFLGKGKGSNQTERTAVCETSDRGNCEKVRMWESQGADQTMFSSCRCISIVKFWKKPDKFSVVDRHRIDADLDPTFHFNPDPDPGTTHVGKPEWQFTQFYLSTQCHRCHNFQYFG